MTDAFLLYTMDNLVILSILDLIWLDAAHHIPSLVSPIYQKIHSYLKYKKTTTSSVFKDTLRDVQINPCKGALCTERDNS